MRRQVFVSLAIAWTLTLASHAAPRLEGDANQAASILAPTNHPVLPSELSRLWLVPGKSNASAVTGAADFLAAMKVADKVDYARALPLLTKAANAQGPLGDYAAYYAALAQLRLGRFTEARALLQQLLARRPVGYIAEAATLASAETAEALHDYDEALEIYERLAATKTTAPEDVLMRLGTAASSAGDNRKAAEAFGRVLYDFPLSGAAAQAQTLYAALPNVQPLTVGSQRYKLELGRGERLFGARRYADARKIFETLRPLAAGDDRELVELRLAESDYYQKRIRPARDAIKPYTTRGSRKGEALFFYALASADLGDAAEFEQAVRRIVADHPTESWAEEALNNLATRLHRRGRRRRGGCRFPRALRRSIRAAATPSARPGRSAGARTGSERPAETVRVLRARGRGLSAIGLPAGVAVLGGRAHERLSEPALADERYTLAAADYLNSYYGRLAVKRLDGRMRRRRACSVSRRRVAAAAAATSRLVRALLRGRAIRRGAERAAVRAAGVGRLAGDSGDDRLDLPAAGHGRIGHTSSSSCCAASINTMRRAYPQFMAAGGEELPREVLTVDLPARLLGPDPQVLERSNELDPYLVAALVAQESTFVPDIRSLGERVGLMQLMPSTARQMRAQAEAAVFAAAC